MAKTKLRSIVSLTGTVTGWAKRLAAQDAAHRVVGVFDVANDVQVKLPGGSVRTDTEIAQAVRRALEWMRWWRTIASSRRCRMAG